MAREVEIQQIDGVTKYRLWSTITDDYLTDWLTKKKVIAFLRKEIEERCRIEIEVLEENFPIGFKEKSKFTKKELNDLSLETCANSYQEAVQIFVKDKNFNNLIKIVSENPQYTFKVQTFNNDDDHPRDFSALYKLKIVKK